MINPCVVIATHDRIEITTINIKQLIAQGVTVVLVVSEFREVKYYDQFFLHVVIAPNSPLGSKWQAGVDYARTLDPSHIVITGSDDLLSMGFFEKYCDICDMIGFNSWFIWNENKLYFTQYMAKQPLGGGRIYSKWALNKVDYKLFDVTKNKLLDDRGWERKFGLWEIISSPEILAVKGNWPVMNKVDLNHRNVKLLATYQGDEARDIMLTKFNYKV